MEIDLDLIPTREERMSSYELMLSESQERMLMVINLTLHRQLVKFLTNGISISCRLVR